MALTDQQKASRLFKKSLGAGETIITRDFFEEPKLGKDSILPSQIWAQADQIPLVAPVLADSGTSGVVQFFSGLTLTFIAGSVKTAQDVSYYHPNLVNAIPFNYGTGYNYALYKNNGTQIAFGDGDWLLDTSAGVLTWYGTVPSLVSSALPPKISFYRYIGTTGITSSTTTSGITSLSTALSSEISTRSSVDTSLSTAVSSVAPVTGSPGNLAMIGPSGTGLVDSGINAALIYAGL
jgi:hypothetical protein